jgi:hypothetical protein
MTTRSNRDVRFTPESGHSPTRSGRLLWAISGLMHRSKTLSLFDHLAVSRQLELEHGTFRYVR